MPDQPPRVKRWTPKTRSGCRTCRARRIKCDETRPICRKCSSGNRECGGYEIGSRQDHAISARRQAILPRQREEEGTPAWSALPALHPLLPVSLSQSDLQAFSYFYHHLTPALSTPFSTPLWSHLIPQATHHSPPTLHAALAFSSLHLARAALVRSPRNSTAVSGPYQAALIHYGLAMSTLRTYIETAPPGSPIETSSTVIICCLLFVCFEMLQGDQRSVLFHLVKSLKILHALCAPQWNSQSSTPGARARRAIVLHPHAKTTADALHDVLVRLDTDSTMFGRRQPYLHPVAADVGVHAAFDSPRVFTSLEAAKTHLDRLSSLAFELRGDLLRVTEREMGQEQLDADFVRAYCIIYAKARRLELEAYPHLAKLKTDLLEAFRCWKEAVRLMQTDLRKSEELATWLLINIQCFYPWYVTATFQDPGDRLCDEYQADFDQVLEVAERYQSMTDSNSNSRDAFKFVLEPEILGPLYLIGTKCRRRATRIKAITLLRNAKAQEGLWNGPLYAAFVEKFMEVEERKARELLRTTSAVIEHIPPAARYSDVMPGLDPEATGWARLACARFGECGLELVEERFRLEFRERRCASITKETACVYHTPPMLDAWEQRVGWDPFLGRAST